MNTVTTQAAPKLLSLARYILRVLHTSLIHIWTYLAEFVERKDNHGDVENIGRT